MQCDVDYYSQLRGANQILGLPLSLEMFCLYILMLPLPSPPGEVEDEAGLESLAATPPGKLGKVRMIKDRRRRRRKWS